MTSMNNLSQLNKIYCRLSSKVQSIGLVLRWMFRKLKGALLRIRPSVWILSGHELRSGQAISVAYSGEEPHLHYWARLIFGAGFNVSYSGKRWVGHKDWGNRGGFLNADISVECMSLRQFKSVQGRPGFLIPSLVRGDMDFSMIDFRKKNLSNDRRKVRKNAFSFEVVTGWNQIERFYKEMYLPYVLDNYGEESCLNTYEGFLWDIENKKLLLISKGGECVAGELFYFKGRHVEVMELAVKPGRPELIKEGAIQALYYFRYLYFKDKPELRIDLMGARPFFNDGVLLFKKKWGYRLTGLLTDTVMWLRIHDDTPAVRSFLINYPFIALEDEKLVGQVFLDEPMDIQDAVIQLRRYLWPGVSKVRGYYFSETEGGPVASSDDGLVEVRPAKDIFAKSRI